MEQKIKQVGIDIGGNIRQIRLSRGIGQTALVRMLQLNNVDMTRESHLDINLANCVDAKVAFLSVSDIPFSPPPFTIFSKFIHTSPDSPC